VVSQSSNAQANTHACSWAQWGCVWGFRLQYLNIFWYKCECLGHTENMDGRWKSGLCCWTVSGTFYFDTVKTFKLTTALCSPWKKQSETLLQPPLRSTEFKCFILKRYCRFWVEYINLIACRCTACQLFGKPPCCFCFSTIMSPWSWQTAFILL